MIVKAVFFDVGGTLVFPNPARIGSTYAEFGTALPTERWLEGIHRATVEFDGRLAGGRKLEEDWWRAYFGLVVENATGRSLTDWPGLDGFLDKLKNDHLAFNLWDTLAPGAVEVATNLQKTGFFLGVISNSDGRVRSQLEQMGLADRFSFIIDSHEAGCEKPGGEIFRLGLKLGGLSPEEVVYIGDFIEIDHRGATGVGMSAIIVDPTRLRRSYPGVEFVDSLSEIPGKISLTD